jgi:cystathionine gamma-lyase
VRSRSSGHQVSFVDFSDLDSVRKSIKEETKMLWFETPSNPLLQIVDLEKIAVLAKSTNAISVCDNTFASPYCQRPLEHGIDIVVHSATKFLNGHSDLLAGVAAISGYAPEGVVDQLRFLQNALGSVLSPNDCAILLRSLKTLPLRMERHFHNAECIANFLFENQSRLGIESINYPGLKDHPGHEIAKSQMHGYGSIITIVVDGGLKRADAVLQRCSLFHFAVSLGGVESLIQHPSSMTHAAIPRKRREEIGLVDGLIRLSVGIESMDDLIVDLEQALQY